MYFLDITYTENDPGVTLHWFRGGWSQLIKIENDILSLCYKDKAHFCSHNINFQLTQILSA